MPGSEKTKMTVLELFKAMAVDAARMGHHEKLLRCLDVLELIWNEDGERDTWLMDLGQTPSKIAESEFRRKHP